MIFQCGDLERALRIPELMPEARAHAERCDACREQLYWWTEISRTAPQLHEEWESPELWPRIETTLAAQPARPRAAMVRMRSRLFLAAAAVVTLAAVLLVPRHPATPAGQDLLTDAAFAEVQRAEAAYAKSIANLAVAVGPQLQNSPTPLAAAYREKLTMLDSAITEVRATAARNPYNAYLRNELASLYGEKKRTLEEWTKDANRH